MGGIPTVNISPKFSGGSQTRRYSK